MLLALNVNPLVASPFHTFIYNQIKEQAMTDYPQLDKVLAAFYEALRMYRMSNHASSLSSIN